MRVLWIYDSLSVQLQRLANRLAERSDISLEIMCRFGEARPDVASSVPMTPLVCRSKFDPEARQQIRQKLQSADFDVVHAYTSRNLANLIGAGRGLRRLPKIVGYRGTINRLRVLDPANWITFWHPRLTHTTCVCQAVREALLKSGLPPSRLSVVWEGCDAEGLPPLAAGSRDEFSIPEDAMVVGSVANMRQG